MFKKFKTFLEEKEKSLVGDVKTKIVADYDGPDEKYPPSNGEKKEKVNPYKPATANINPNKTEKGFADLGDSDLVYEPMKNGEKEKVLGSYPKTKNEQFIEKTSKLDDKAFVKFMLKENRKKQKNINENSKILNNKFAMIKHIAELANKDQTCVENFIHDSKRSGSLKKILDYALNLTETYSILAELFYDKEQGNSRFCRLERALEQVGLPQHKQDDLNPKKSNHDMSDMDHDDDMDSDDDMNDIDHDDMDSDYDMNDIDHDDMDSDDDMSDMDHDDMDSDDDMSDMDHDDMDSDDDMSDMDHDDDMNGKVGMIKQNPFSKKFR